MRITRAAIKVHKWLALILGVQILLWFVSGLFMVHFPIEEVRGEHMIREQTPATFSPAAVSRQVAEALPMGMNGASRMEVRTMLGRPVLLVERPEGRPLLFDASDGTLLSPIPAATAVEIARADYAGAGRPARTLLIEEASTEYRGALPAWRVDFADDSETAIYVAADLAKVTARRTELWRTYDFLWSLHIMDWKNHVDFNSWWLWLATAASLIAIIAGIMILPKSFGLLRKKRR